MRRPSLLLASVAAALAVAACTGGGGPPTGNDGGSSGGSDGGGGGAALDASTTTPNDAPCVLAKVPDPNAGSSGGPRGCTQPSDCTVRLTGTSFCCPNEPQAMTNGVAAIFDESRNGFPERCSKPCEVVRCAMPPRATATCESGSCVLAPDAG